MPIRKILVVDDSPVERLALQEVLGRNAKGLPLTMTDPEMGAVTFTYDASNRVTSIASPVKGTTTLGYTGTSRVPSTITDQYGKTTTNTLNG
ncbi:MAG TPA: hypothetical protein PK889_05135, partial [Thauera aminoaromatica]|nr:hypothetical protein [Thauera aminoaromatica]